MIPSITAPTAVPPTPTPVPPAASDTFPAGVWFECHNCSGSLQGVTTIYYEDGTYVSDKNWVEWIRGKWHVEGDIVYSGDNWCHDEDTMPGAYKWHFDGEDLTLELIDDHCADRSDGLVGRSWRIVETSPIPMGSFSTRNGDYILEIGEDNNFTVSEKNGKYNTSGTFSTNDQHQITWETDSYCDQENPGKATYGWNFENNVLSFGLIGKDPCAARKAFLTFYYKMEP